MLPDRQRGERVSVVLHRTLLPEAHQCPTCQLYGSWFLPRHAYEPLPLGCDAFGEQVTVRLFDAENGGSSVLVGGVPGVGKTNAIRVLLAGLSPTTTSIVAIDPTGGAEASLWSERLAALVTTAEPDPTIDLLRRVLDLIERRGRLLSAGAHLSSLTPFLVVCDELAELAAAATPKQQEEARAMLRRVIALGRKANVACLFATQRTTATSIDITTRALVATRIALAHPDDLHGSEALLGQGRREAASLRQADRGAAFITTGGTPRLLRVFDASQLDVSSVAQLGSSRRIDELEHWENAAYRELTAS